MLNGLVEFITVSSILISVQLKIGLSEGTDTNYCARILKRESILRWSEDKQTFVVLPLNSEDKDASIFDELSAFTELPDDKSDETKRSGDYVICIRAPVDHHVEVTLSLDPISEHNFDHLDNCYNDPTCNVSCLAINDQGNDTPYIKNESFSLNIINRTGGENLFHVSNSSTKEDNVERFPRHSLQIATKRNDTHVHSTSTIANLNGPGKRRKPRKCKNCRKRVNRWRRQRNRERKLFKLLITYHKLFMKTDAQYRLRPAPNNNDLPMKEDLKESAALLKARERFHRYVFPGNRTHNLKGRTSIPNSSQGITGSRTALTDPVSGTIPINTKQRRRRRESIATNKTKIGGNSSHTTAGRYVFPRFTLCGLEAFWNSSEGREHVISKEKRVNSTLVRAVRQQKRYFTKEGSEIIAENNWISMEAPLRITSVGPEMRLYKLGVPSGNNTSLRFLVVQISFVQNERKRSTGASILTSIGQQPISSYIVTTGITDVTNETEFQRNTSILLYSENVPVGMDGDNIKIIVGVAVGFILAIAAAFLCVFIKYRRKVSRQFRKRCTCFADVETPEIYAYNRRKKKRRRNKKNQSDLPEESEVTMLEHEKQKRSLSSRKNAARSGLNNSKHQLPKCKHLHVAKGTSKHTFCFLCQSAQKPHQPITTAQHASEFLPPASRQPNIGYSATLPTFQNNFDKFNRMPNNPYRYSPSLPVRHVTLPSTVTLPDGEEIYKGQDQKPLMRAGNTDGKGEDTNYIKSPPNRTIFESEALPWGSSNIHRKGRKANGYPGPPSAGSKHISRHHHENSRTHSVKITDDGQLKYHDSSNEAGLCKCRLNHMGELPPEYSDVIREDVPLRGTLTGSAEAFGCSTTHNKDGLNINNNKSPSANAKRNGEKTFLEKRESSQLIDNAKSHGT